MHFQAQTLLSKIIVNWTLQSCIKELWRALEGLLKMRLESADDAYQLARLVSRSAGSIRVPRVSLAKYRLSRASRKPTSFRRSPPMLAQSSTGRTLHAGRVCSCTPNPDSARPTSRQLAPRCGRAVAQRRRPGLLSAHPSGDWRSVLTLLLPKWAKRGRFA